MTKIIGLDGPEAALFVPPVRRHEGREMSVCKGRSDPGQWGAYGDIEPLAEIMVELVERRG